MRSRGKRRCSSRRQNFRSGFEWRTRGLTFALALLLHAGAMGAPVVAASGLRIGIIGTDTPHCIYFTEILNNPGHAEHVRGGRVVIAYKGGSPDIPQSVAKVHGFARELEEKFQIQIVDDVETLARDVDAIIVGSIDGRTHLEFVRRVLPFRRPLFVDKPLGGTLRDSIEIFRLARAAGVPCFSASSLRFVKSKAALKAATYGEIRGATSQGPGTLEPHHPDLFWYGIHAVESLYTVLGIGCESVARTHTADMDVLTGVWNGGKIGIVRVMRNGPAPYGVTIFGTKALVTERVERSYAPLVAEMMVFFQTGRSPVPEAETIELLAFMEAGDESKRRGGVPVRIAEVLARHAR
jgi:predicted dehydrogenase